MFSSLIEQLEYLARRGDTKSAERLETTFKLTSHNASPREQGVDVEDLGKVINRLWIRGSRGSSLVEVEKDR